ncbi:hypothetical protein BZL30_0396 [Mycobacterium kansasii]|uniref:Uncharacterized protein n=1 Tax=Mycobacterium kansasii TaxID=1768 RepID=A0A1V3XRX3_MYCKA|nr:hypothetical protein BZL30_0396 [Mycobacterium kansasii]
MPTERTARCARPPRPDNRCSGSDCRRRRRASRVVPCRP